MTFTYVLTIYLRFILSIILSYPICPLLRTISTSVIVLFSHMNTKLVYHIHPPSPSPFSFPPPTGMHPL
jgi:hypothetical protein